MRDEKDRLKIADAIRAYIARERISREEFARRAKVGKSTVDKLVTGLFTDKTVLQIESQTGLRLLDTVTQEGAASEALGGYARDDVKHYIGSYVLVRPSLQEKMSIHAFAMEIAWDDQTPSLLVREAAAGAELPAQLGRMYIPRASMHVFVLSNERGWLKQLILSQLDVYKTMRGVMLTMGHAFGNLYVPAAMPVVMKKVDTIDGEAIGEFSPGTGMHDGYRQDLKSVEEGRFVRWVSVGGNDERQ